VGGRGAAGALDRGWETAEAAVNGEQELWRSSGGASRSGRRKAVQMWVRECKRECTGSSGMCFKLRREHSERGQVLASSAARVSARAAAAARRGGAGRGPARGGERRARCWDGTWREEGQRGAAGARHMAGKSGGDTGTGQSRGGGLEVEDRDLSTIF
jgi:hypothetical protein